MSQPQEIAGLLVSADADFSPVDSKLASFERRMQDSASRIDRSYERVGSRAFTGLEQATQRLTQRIPVVGGVLSQLEGKLSTVRQSFFAAGESAATAMISAQRHVENLGAKITATQAKLDTLLSRRASVVTGFEQSVGDLTRRISNRTGTDVRAPFLNQLNQVSGDQRAALIAGHLGTDNVALINTVDAAALSYAKLQRTAAKSLVEIDGQVAKTQTEMVAFQGAVSSANESMASFAAGGGGVTTTLGEMAPVVSALAIALVAVGVATVGTEFLLFKLASGAAAIGAKFKDLSLETGFSAHELSALEVTGSQVGVSFGQIGAALGIFDKKLEAGAEHSTKLSRVLKDQGVNVRDNQAALEGLFRILSRMPEGETKTALATESFGKSGKAMLAIVAQAKGDLPTYIKLLDQMGATLSDKDAAAAQEFEAKQKLLEHQFDVMKVKVGEELMPTFERMFNSLSAWLAKNQGEFSQWGQTFASVAQGIMSWADGVANRFRMVRNFEERLVNGGTTDGPVGIRKVNGRQVGSSLSAGGVGSIADSLKSDEARSLVEQGSAELAARVSHLMGEKPGGGHKKKGGGDAKAVAAAREEIAGLEIVRQAEDRIYQQRTADEQFYFQNSLKGLDAFVQMRRTLEDEHLKQELVVAQKELAIAKSIPGNSQKKQNEVAKAEEKVNAIYARAQANNTEIDRQAYLTQTQSMKQSWDEKLSLLQTTESGFESVYNSMAERGVMSFKDAQQRIADLQYEILLSQQKGIERQLTRVNPGTLQADALNSQLDQIKQEIANFNAETSEAGLAADRKDYDRNQTRLSQIRDFYRQIEDLTSQSQQQRLSILEKAGVREEDIWQRQLTFDLDQERVRAARAVDDLRLLRDNTEKNVAIEQGREELIKAIDARIVAEEQSSAEKRKAVWEDFYAKQNAKLESLADKAIGILDKALGQLKDGGFKAFFTSIGEDFYAAVLKMEEDLLKSRLMQMLRQITHTPLPGATTGDPAAKEAATPSRDFGTFGDVFGALIGKIFHPSGGGSSPSADATAVSAAGKEAKGAIQEGWHNSVVQISKTGDAHAKTLTSVGQSIVSTMLSIASVIAAGAGQGSFWKGLLLAAGVGAISGAVGKLFAPHDSSGGQSGATNIGGGQTTAAGGGLLKGPGTPTSDSILGIDPRSGLATAWVSAGEYVVKGSAVAKLGVGVLDYINRMGELPRSVMMSLGHMPAFADGGFASSTSGYVPPVYNSSSSTDNSRNVTVHQVNHFNIDGQGQSEQGVRKTARQIARASRKALATLSE